MLLDCVSLIQKKRLQMSIARADDLLAARCGDDVCAARVEVPLKQKRQNFSSNKRKELAATI
jgi:hypothetical protein